ncbi:MAG TPA: hypothetical protein VHO02_01365 [Fibrobacteria bacterium]|nr:hypothetical protein [Fibrobacteria bacterium]
MKKIVSAFSIAAFLVAAAPTKPRAQILEGALIGAAIGATVGVVMTLLKPKPAKEPKVVEPPMSAPVDTAAAVPAPAK